MSEKTDEKCYKSTPAKDLEDRITNPNIPKSEAEWWAKGEIERLRGRLALIEGERCVWKKENNGINVYLTSCNMIEVFEGYTYCPCCGKKIEVSPS